MGGRGVSFLSAELCPRSTDNLSLPIHHSSRVAVVDTGTHSMGKADRAMVDMVAHSTTHPCRGSTAYMVRKSMCQLLPQQRSSQTARDRHNSRRAPRDTAR
jgi:hypothetical protein